MRAQVLLTPAESKRLIAMGVVKSHIFKRAFESGIVILTRSTTTAFIVEELFDVVPEKERYACGIVTPHGTCVTDPRFGMTKPVIIEKGEMCQQGSLLETLKRMDGDDVVVKSANAIDPWGNAGVFIGERPDGGEIGRALGSIAANDINLVIPVGLEKSLLIPIDEASRISSTVGMDYSMGEPVKLLPISGWVITEREAIQIVTDNQVKVTAIGAGGIGGAEGAVVLVVQGETDPVQMAVQAIEKVKGERALRAMKPRCSSCKASKCIYRGTQTEDLSTFFRKFRNWT